MASGHNAAVTKVLRHRESPRGSLAGTLEIAELVGIGEQFQLVFALHHKSATTSGHLEAWESTVPMSASTFH